MAGGKWWRQHSGIDGIKDVERAFDRLGKVPQTISTKSARAGATVALRAAKRNAPVDTGDLKRGIILKRERTKTPGKAVYDVTMNPAMNDVFQKQTKTGMRRRGSSMGKGGYYYPASQEYGFLTVDGRYIPGYGYLRKAVDENRRQIEARILDVTGKEIDKALRKR